MDKQAWIAISLSVVGLVVWQFYFAPKYLPTPVPAVATATPGASPGGSPGVLTRDTSSKGEIVVDQKEAAPAAPSADTAPEQIETVTTPQLILDFTNLGGGIKEAIPRGPQHLAENGEDIRLNHAGQTAIGALSFLPYAPLPASKRASSGVGEDPRAPYTVHRDGNKVICERTEPDGLNIVKEYTLDYQGDDKQIPAIRLKVTFKNTGAQPYKNDGYSINAGSAAPIHRLDGPQYTSYDWMSGGNYSTTHGTSFDASHVPGFGHEGHDVIITPVSRASWLAVKNQFYTTIVTPLDITPDGQEPAAREIVARRFDLALTAQDAADALPPLHGIEAMLGLPGLSLAPGESKTANFQIYAGPKFYSRLDRLGHEEEKVMDFGKFKVVSIALLAMMNTFKSWLGNYGLAIILLTLIVKGVLFPLQNRANKSMKRMSALQPKMAELREKYKDDPARINTETMKLYKEFGVNPLGGCLPMLIQMPIFFGFLYMLYTAAELRNAHFLWVHDLSQPDTVAHFFGKNLNILPLFMIGTQFWQMQLTPKSGDPSQQKMMMFMPLLFGFFCYNLAAALTLYYTMQGALTILQLYLTRSQPPPTLESGGVAAKPVPVRGGPGGFGGGRKAPKRLNT